MALRFLKITLVVPLIVVAAGCSTKIVYQDPQSVETVNENFGSTDLQQIATAMVDDMLSFGPLVKITANSRPVMFVDQIKNKTSEHIDTESITDTIQSRLLRSGSYRFIDTTALKQVKDQLSYQQDTGLVNQATAVKVGRQIGAQYMLYGNLSSIVKRQSDKRSVYYKFTLKLLDLESGLIEWTDEKEIRKLREKSLLGL
ncbi:penicillin-binding protein activator LpoB [Pelagibaculum spongiae]|uniref:Penicillin-binding protein activator LpoB n=2 Tax=Pelagibaculum spongiae TaxID=2080658 RepID=A0A2V1H3N6_9GAMM|nr:penicillin-binding protein activator LpoB [Pelagibaculum spongiae]